MTSALNGGNIGIAIGSGLVGYFGGLGVGGMFGSFWGTMAAGTLGGASGAGMAGADAGMGALSGLAGSLSGYGAGAISGFAGLGTIIGGGVSAEVSGGDFGEGALGGLAYNIGFTIGSTFAPMSKAEDANVESGDQVFLAGDRIGKGQGLKGWLFSGAMAILDPGPFNHTGIGLGGGKIVDSHPDASGETYNGPGVRNLKGENQFSAYKGEKAAVVKHSKSLGVCAETVANRMQQEKVTFGGGPFGGGDKTTYCSQFTSEVYKTSGETGVYGSGPNTQYWYTK